MTTLWLLAIYWRLGCRFLYLMGWRVCELVEASGSSDDAYVVEDYGLGCLIENIELEEA